MVGLPLRMMAAVAAAAWLLMMGELATTLMVAMVATVLPAPSLVLPWTTVAVVVAVVAMALHPLEEMGGGGNGAGTGTSPQNGSDNTGGGGGGGSMSSTDAYRNAANGGQASS